MRQAGRVLNGATPAELPIVQPIKLQLVINRAHRAGRSERDCRFQRELSVATAREQFWRTALRRPDRCSNRRMVQVHGNIWEKKDVRATICSVDANLGIGASPSCLAAQ
jgi:hypothetical protein